jgi:hypothetical protein
MKKLLQVEGEIMGVIGEKTTDGTVSKDEQKLEKEIEQRRLDRMWDEMLALKKKLGDKGKLSKEELARLEVLEEKIMESLRNQIADIEANIPPALKPEQELHLLGLKEKLL